MHLVAAAELAPDRVEADPDRLAEEVRELLRLGLRLRHQHRLLLAILLVLRKQRNLVRSRHHGYRFGQGLEIVGGVRLRDFYLGDRGLLRRGALALATLAARTTPPAIVNSGRQPMRV